MLFFVYREEPANNLNGMAEVVQNSTEHHHDHDQSSILNRLMTLSVEILSRIKKIELIGLYKMNLRNVIQ